MDSIVIIGNGISGITTARQVRKRSDVPITVISSETEHFFSRTALMYIFMGHMKYEHTKPYEDWFWEKNKIDLVFDHVNEIDFDGKNLKMKSGKDISYGKLVLALGSKSNRFGWKGQDLNGVQSLYSYQDLELLEKQAQKGIKHAVLVGGGLIGVELAEMLLVRGTPVTFLVREGKFWGSVLPAGEAGIVGRHMTEEHHVNIKYHSNLKEIVDDGTGQVKSVIVEETGEEIPCDFVGLTAGVSPNIDFLKGSKLETDRGILINEYLETSILDVYSLGDCAQFREAPEGRKNIEQVWYTGRMMGECLGQTLTGKKTPYLPGVWFNSAKFFDIEYQTYGWVMAELRDGETNFYWEHPNGKKCLHAVFNKETHELIGVNVFGIRLRHHYMNELIGNKKTVEDFLAHLKDALFDPEFYKNHSKEIVEDFNQKFTADVQLKSKSWKRIMNAFKSASQV